MTDISALFHAVADNAPAAAEVVEADLGRGRAALARDHRRRTVRRSLLTTTSLAAAAVVAVVATQGSSPSAPPTAQGPSVSPTTAQPVAPAQIQLVRYTGGQLEGFTVDRLPAGWELSSSTQYALLITPAGSTDDRPDVFEGKLAVLTSSLDATGLGEGRQVTVNGREGRVMDQGEYGITLRYTDPRGFGVDIQAPLALHWTDDQVVAFAEGVHVTRDAVHSRG
jgi:hypothetical protein